jgi:hypothetical protein
MDFILMILVLIAIGLAGYTLYKSSAVPAEVSSISAEMRSITAEMHAGNKIGETGRAIVTSVNTNKGTGARTDLFPVKFTQTYPSAPKVILATVQLDVGTPPNLRYTVTPQDITATGFNVNLSTWADSVLYSAVVDWATIVPA